MTFWAFSSVIQPQQKIENNFGWQVQEFKDLVTVCAVRESPKIIILSNCDLERQILKNNESFIRNINIVEKQIYCKKQHFRQS